MSHLHKKLFSYSAAAATFILLNSKADGQIVYHNIDPDTLLEENGIYELDFNDDGITDIIFKGDFSLSTSFSTSWFSVFYRHQKFYISGFDAVVDDPSMPASFGVQNLDSSYIVGESALWNTADEIILGNFYTHFNDFYHDDANWFHDDQQLGVRFLIDGEYHYGWVRLSINDFNKYEELPKLIVQDYAYEAIPGQPILINSYTASLATDVKLIDRGELTSPTDLNITFTKAENESYISAYRIYLYKYSFFPDTIPSISYLSGLSADNYIEIIPDGEDVSVFLSADAIDIEGNPIQPGINYRAIIVSVADGINSTTDNVSLVTWNESFYIRSAPYISKLYLDDEGDNCDISDYHVSFISYSDLYGVIEYRVYITSNGDESIPELLGLDSNYYYSVLPHIEDEHYELDMPADIYLYDDDVPILFNEYFSVVVAIPDGISTTNTSYDRTWYEDDEGYISGGYLFYCTENDLLPFATVDAMDDDPSSIKVQFDEFINAVEIEDYYVVAVKHSEVNELEPSDIWDLNSTQYKIIHPGEPSYDFHLKSSMKDTDGDVILPGVEYNIVVALKYSYSTFSLSQPSNTVSLYVPNSVHDDAVSDEIICTNNFLHIKSWEGISNMRIMNAVGAQVYDAHSNVESVTNLNFLPAGIYFVVLNKEELKVIVKIEINH